MGEGNNFLDEERAWCIIAKLLRRLCIQKHQWGIRSVAAQCNMPVWMWLYGEEKGVSVEQVRRVVTPDGKQHNTAGKDILASGVV